MSALDWLLQDQRGSGLSVREYERIHGVFLSTGTRRPMGRAADIRAREVRLIDVGPFPDDGQERLEHHMLGEWDDSAFTDHLASLRPRDAGSG